MKLLKYLLGGFALSLVFFAIFEMHLVSGLKTKDKIFEAVTFCLIVTPLVAAAIWAIKVAAIPLLQEFINGDWRTKLLITTIVIVLWQMKMSQHF